MRENKEKESRERIKFELETNIERELRESLPKMISMEIKRDYEKQLRDEFECRLSV